MTHISVWKLTSIGRRQAIIWTNAAILLIRTIGTTFSEILSEIHKFSFRNMHFNISSAKWRQFCLGPAQCVKTYVLSVITSFCVHVLVNRYMLSIQDRIQVLSQHLEAETRWPPFCIRHFQTNFLERKCLNFDWDVTEVFFQRVNLTIFHHWFR